MGNVTPDCAPAAPIDLQRWTSFRTVRNGARVCIRPLRPDDRDREVAFIESLSQRTRYLRMMSPLRFLSQHLLDQLMAIDYSHSMAFAATVGAGDAEEFVGLGRYGKTDEPDVVELGITVTDRWQRQGIAKELIDQLVQYAASRGYRRMIGWVLHENGPMLSLARACGFQVRFAPHHGTMEIDRQLADAATTSPS
jgi:RimJ/RimL family protein N-acetyltransferase